MTPYECIRCGMPLTEETGATFGKELVCMELGGCMLRQASIHNATTNWKPKRRTRGLVVMKRKLALRIILESSEAVPLVKVISEGVVE
jgi:hypothetical protein